MYTVIRVIKYESESEEALRKQIANSMPDGFHDKHIAITVGTYFSDLPPAAILMEVDNEELHKVLNDARDKS